MGSLGTVVGRNLEEVPVQVTVTIPLQVANPPVAMTTQLPFAYVGVPYSAQLVAKDGIQPGYWMTNSALPLGLTLNPDGTITGTPQSPFTGSPTFVYVDAGG